MIAASRTLAIITSLFSFSANAEITEGGRGMLFGVDHAYAVTAKHDWVLDNQSGAAQGLHMVFYPKGETWSTTPVFAYGRSIPTTEAADIETHVKNTVQEFRKDGNPNYVSQKQAQLTLKNGQKPEIYFYSGDQWGNYEAAAYFRETDTINYLVFNSRTKESFDRHLPDFMQIASSYRNLYKPATAVTVEKLKQLKSESSFLLKQPDGKEYKARALQAVGQMMANTMRDCTAYLRDANMPAFHYFIRIDKKGDILDSNIYPTNALSVCFSGTMSVAEYPAHSFESFLLHIEMKITP
jgi:hypothetical protein